MRPRQNGALLMLAASMAMAAAAPPPSSKPASGSVPAMPMPYPLGPVGTVEGSQRTVERMFAAVDAGDDAGYDHIARGIVVMLAPDFAVAATRGQFAEVLTGCNGRRIAGARPFARTPPAQVVRVTMRCPVEGKPNDVVADVLADDAHAFAFFPGGIDAVWPPASERH